MIIQTIKRFRWFFLTFGLFSPGLLLLALPGLVVADSGKTKVRNHVAEKDPDIAEYAIPYINKHIKAEVRPDRIDGVLIAHGPAPKLFEKMTVVPALHDKLKVLLDKGAQAEMCHVSMKLCGITFGKSVDGFKPTAYPVAFKRIANLQKEGCEQINL